jgi:hypothetical protein
MEIKIINQSEPQFPDDSTVLVWYPLPGADQPIATRGRGCPGRSSTSAAPMSGMS